VPILVFPPTTELGEKDNVLTGAGCMVSVAVWSIPGIAVMVAIVLVETAVVLTVKVAEV